MDSYSISRKLPCENWCLNMNEIMTEMTQSVKKKENNAMERLTNGRMFLEPTKRPPMVLDLWLELDLELLTMPCMAMEQMMRDPRPERSKKTPVVT